MAYVKMDPDTKVKWVAALRSGTFRQGTGFLAAKRGDEKFGHCCLGVLCAITPKVKSAGEISRGVRAYRYGGSVSDAFLPKPFAEAVGLDQATQDRLANMNDNGLSFDEIADWIDENL